MAMTRMTTIEGGQEDEEEMAQSPSSPTTTKRSEMPSLTTWTSSCSTSSANFASRLPFEQLSGEAKVIRGRQVEMLVPSATTPPASRTTN